VGFRELAEGAGSQVATVVRARGGEKIVVIKSYHEKRGLVAFEKAITTGSVDRLWYSSTTLVNMLEAEPVLGENSTAWGNRLSVSVPRT